MERFIAVLFFHEVTKISGFSHLDISRLEFQLLFPMMWLDSIFFNVEMNGL